MKKTIRVGDLCKNTKGDTWCKLTSIKDDLGNLYNEYDVVTGEGHLNSKVLLRVKPILNFDLTNTDDKEDWVDPHGVYFSYDYWIKETEDLINFYKKKKEFLLKHRNRLDKIDDLLNQ